ncbi:MAG: hypothetical protein PHV28_07275 [Kiritimatiellae bacterium]|nr:hypothetical protein [Kiritimatiellia bacterium]
MMRTKKARGSVLDEFCRMTGLTRKHAVKRLSPKRLPGRRRGRPPGGTPEGTALLVRLWKLSDMMCGKLLQAVLGLYLESLRKRGDIPDEVCAEVLGMSAATIDRRLRRVKVSAAGGRGRRRKSSLEEHRREIPLKIDVWPEAYPKTPGYIEVDTVAHCGGSMTGSFVWTLTMTDVATHWTELRAVWNKGAAAVCGGISEFISGAPFLVLMLNSDNGGECINGHIKRHFAQFLPKVLRTRSRSYRKNDNAHVEQKNGAQVRALYGHGRIDDERLLPLMNRINECQGLIKNLFTPTMRLLSKERVGSKCVKRYEKKAKTPALRVLESPDVTESQKDRIRAMLAANDIVELRERLNADLRLLARELAAAPKGATPKGRPGCPSDLPGPRPSASKHGARTTALESSRKRLERKTSLNFGVVFI